MSVYIQGQIVSVYKKEGFLDKKTGEQGATKTRIQIQQFVDQESGGKRLETIEVSAPENHFTFAESIVGKHVLLRVNTTASGGNVYYFLGKDSHINDYLEWKEDILKPYKQELKRAS